MPMAESMNDEFTPKIPEYQTYLLPMEITAPKRSSWVNEYWPGTYVAVIPSNRALFRGHRLD
jgi:hypothetical protein